MLIITHAITGAVIGQAVKNSPLSFVLGIIVHFLMDVIPHGDSQDYERYKKTNVIPKGQIYQLIFDNVTMFALVIYILVYNVETNWWPIFWGITGSVIPDIFVGIHELKANKFTAPIHRIHFFFHSLITSRQKDIRLRYAVIIQLIAIIIALRFI